MTYEAWRISYQSSEQSARAAYAECVRLSARLEAAEKERDDLRAKVEAMEKQEPVAWIVAPSSRPFWGEYARQDAESEARRCGGTAKAEPIYLSPGAQPAPSVLDLLESLRCACNYIDKLGGVSQQYRAMLASLEAKP